MPTRLAIGLALLGLVQCTESHVLLEDAGPPPTDAGPPPSCSPPEDDFGTSVGSRFLPFTLETCAGESYEFYGEDEGFCDTTFTVLSVCAGWCGPCRREAMLMREFVIDRYATHGVRVISTLVQNDDFVAPSSGYCEEWQSRYDLTNVLLDPTMETQVYFPRDSYPANLIVDAEGVIRHREYGVTSDLESLRAALDELLGL